MGFLDKAKEVLQRRTPTRSSTAIDKAGDLVDEKTQGKYAEHGRQGAGRRQEGRRQGRPRRGQATRRSRSPTATAGQVRTPQQQPPTAPPTRTYGWRNSPSPSTFRYRRSRRGQHASDLSRYKEWLTIHRVWRSKLPETLDKGTVVESIVEVKGMPNRIKWTIVHFKPPEAMTLNGDGVGGVKVKLIGKVRPARIRRRLLGGHLGRPPGRPGAVRADRHGRRRRAARRHPRIAGEVQDGLRAVLTSGPDDPVRGRVGMHPHDPVPRARRRL